MPHVSDAGVPYTVCEALACALRGELCLPHHAAVCWRSRQRQLVCLTALKPISCAVMLSHKTCSAAAVAVLCCTCRYHHPLAAGPAQLHAYDMWSAGVVMVRGCLHSTRYVAAAAALAEPGQHVHSMWPIGVVLPDCWTLPLMRLCSVARLSAAVCTFYPTDNICCCCCCCALPPPCQLELVLGTPAVFAPSPATRAALDKQLRLRGRPSGERQLLYLLRGLMELCLYPGRVSACLLWYVALWQKCVLRSLDLQ
jgi:hypothetical protein